MMTEETIDGGSVDKKGTRDWYLSRKRVEQGACFCHVRNMVNAKRIDGR